jgi:hypothetical protein
MILNALLVGRVIKTGILGVICNKNATRNSQPVGVG